MTVTSLTASSQTVQAQTDHPLAPLASEDTMPHPALQAAWEDYQTLSQELTFSSIEGESENITTIDDILDTYDFDAELEEKTINDNEEQLIYHYQFANPEDAGSPDKARILFHFMDEQLLMIGLFNGIHLASADYFMSPEATYDIFTNGASIDELAEHQPQVTAMAEMVFQDEPVSMLISFSGESVEDAMTDFFIVKEGQVVDVFQTEMAAGATGFEQLAIEGFLTYFHNVGEASN